jgi:hypothetical protein
MTWAEALIVLALLAWALNFSHRATKNMKQPVESRLADVKTPGGPEPTAPGHPINWADDDWDTWVEWQRSNA